MDNNFDYHNKVQSHNNFLYNNLELNDDNEDHEMEGNNAAYDVEVEGNDDLLTYGEEVGPYVEDDVYDVGYDIIDKCISGEIDYRDVTLEYILNLVDPIDW